MLSDFGISHMLSSTTAFMGTTGGLKGSVRWMAYEQLTGAAESVFSKEADVWAFGMTIYVSRISIHMIMISDVVLAVGASDQKVAVFSAHS